MPPGLTLVGQGGQALDFGVGLEQPVDASAAEGRQAQQEGRGEGAHWCKYWAGCARVDDRRAGREKKTTRCVRLCSRAACSLEDWLGVGDSARLVKVRWG